jgi:hypothetical protein
MRAIHIVGTAVALALGTSTVGAQIGGSGRDGAFQPRVVEVVLDTSLNQGRFEFTTVRIDAGVTVRFVGPHPAVVSVQGVVDVRGHVVADGGIGGRTGLPGRGAAGGHDGGAGGLPAGSGAPGQGPGAGGGGPAGVPGGAGGHATPGVRIAPSGAPGAAYGAVVPFELRGGSGGGGAGGDVVAQGAGGGAGGGVLVIATDDTITIGPSGGIRANGGGSEAGAGAGGSVLLRAMRGIVVQGGVEALGGVSPIGNAGGDGFVRLDAHRQVPDVRGRVQPAPTVLELPFARATDAPRLGRLWTVETHTVPGTVVFWLLGAREADVALPPLGRLRLDLSAPVVLAAITPAQAVALDSVAVLSLPVPADPRLVGGTLHVQGVEAGVRTTPPSLTGLVSGTIRP